MPDRDILTVRFARIEELESINEIRRQVNDLHVFGRPDIFRSGFCEELKEHIYDVFGVENKAIVVCLCGDTICGFATVEYMTKPLSPYSLERKIYQIEEFGVDERFRRRGVGTALIEFMKRDALENGYDKLELDMWTFNEGAYEFYKAAGFTTYRRYMELSAGGYPTRKKAHDILSEAQTLNLGAWIAHSITAARCAEAIARECDGMDEEKAYVLGLLHDIGRRNGKSYLKHVYDGYTFMNSLGYPVSARICLTHSFSVQSMSDYIGECDVTSEQRDFIESQLAKCVYDDYDRLIQLCDAIAMSTGAVMIEKRMNDVKSRYGAYPQQKWDKNLAIKNYFEIKAGKTIEEITQGINGNF